MEREGDVAGDGEMGKTAGFAMTRPTRRFPRECRSLLTADLDRVADGGAVNWMVATSGLMRPRWRAAAKDLPDPDGPKTTV